MAMPPSCPAAQLDNFVQSMVEEGILDDQFSLIQALQDQESPNFVTQVITTFCANTQIMIAEMSKYLSHPNTDFSKLDYCVYRLKGSSSSIGAQRMKNACTKLGQASQDKNKQIYEEVLNVIAQEFCLLQNKFAAIVQLEKRITLCGTNQQQSNGKIDTTL